MKKFIYASMAVAAMAFVSCSDDDDSSSEAANATDCFECTTIAGDMKYCYTEGDDYYTMTVMEIDTEMPLNGQSWEDTKQGLQMLCN